MHAQEDPQSVQALFNPFEALSLESLPKGVMNVIPVVANTMPDSSNSGRSEQTTERPAFSNELKTPYFHAMILDSPERQHQSPEAIVLDPQSPVDIVMQASAPNSTESSTNNRQHYIPSNRSSPGAQIFRSNSADISQTDKTQLLDIRSRLFGLRPKYGDPLTFEMIPWPILIPEGANADYAYTTLKDAIVSQERREYKLDGFNKSFATPGLERLALLEIEKFFEKSRRLTFRMQSFREKYTEFSNREFADKCAEGHADSILRGAQFVLDCIPADPSLSPASAALRSRDYTGSSVSSMSL
jgi:hypothetical protein